MPNRPSRPCSGPHDRPLARCPHGALATHRDGRCDACTRPAWRRRPHTDSGYVRQQWSKAVLARDPICTVCGQRPSTEADHIRPEAEGGRATMDNGRGVCRPCNLALMQERRNR